MEQLELRVGNLDCEHDAAAIERGLATFDGLDSLKVYPSAAKVSLTYDPAVTDPAAGPGDHARPPADAAAGDETETAPSPDAGDTTDSDEGTSTRNV